MHIVDDAKLDEFHGAYTYGHVSTIGWLYKQLLSLYEIVQSGTPIRVEDHTVSVLRTTQEFTEWVHHTYPGFQDDCLHPFFSTR